MPKFTYKARNPEGRVLEGTVEADNVDSARSVLRARRFSVLDLSEVKGRGFFRRGPKVSSHDVVIFSRQLATMQAAALPLVQAVNIIAEQTESKGFKAILTQVRDDISSGSQMSEALAKHPSAFPPLYVNMVRAGEQGGSLESILERLSVHLERSELLAQKIQGAMMYPAVIMVVAIGIVSFLMIKVIPSFEEVFSQFGAELPLPTKILLAVSKFFQTKLIHMIVTSVALVVGFNALKRTESGARMIDSALLKVPVLGSLLLKYSIALFARTLGVLLKSGVHILESMEIVAKIAGNKVIEGAIMKARLSMREGEGVAGPLRASGVFPPMVLQMVNAGEETGKLDEMLLRIAQFYDTEVEVSVEALMKLIEPIMMVGMGGLVGLIVLGMFLPMFAMSTMAG